MSSATETLGSIGGVFEPFKKYVQEQLDIRKTILSNARLDNEDTLQDEYIDFRTDSRFGTTNNESFYAYTVEKQSFIRMMSGVDLKIQKTNIATELKLNEFEKNEFLKEGQRLAEYYVLDGGTRKINAGIRGGYEDSKVQNATYGDPSIRSDSDSDYGEVPMPGITNAEIRTKGNNGELREARINFVCYNRRQLDMLETLYMRPGHYVAIEWGWDPYIDNNYDRQNNDFSIAGMFFHPGEQTIDDINQMISKIKEFSGGNYDGFIGAVKNYTYKAREDGGFDCVTELMAAGELLESLKGYQKTYATNIKLPNSNQYEIEVKDSFYYYLKSIKHSLDRDADELMIQLNSTQRELLGGVNQVDVSAIAGSTTNQELRNMIADHYQALIDSGDPNVTKEMVDNILSAKYIGGQCPELGTKSRGPWVEFIEYINPGYFTCFYTNGESVNVIAYNNQGKQVTPMNRRDGQFSSSAGRGGVNANVDYGMGGARREEWTIIGNPYNNSKYDHKPSSYDIGEARREHLIRYPENAWKYGDGGQEGLWKLNGWNNWLWDHAFPDDWSPYYPDHGKDYDWMDYFKGCRIVTNDVESYYRWDKTNGSNKINTKYPLAVIKNGKPGIEYKYLPKGQKNGVYDLGHEGAGDYSDDSKSGYSHFKDERLYAKVQEVEEQINQIITDKIGQAAEQELIESQHYEQGVMDIIALYKWIQKISDTLPEEEETTVENANDSTKTYRTPFGMDPMIGEGLESMLGGTIIKQVSKYKETYYVEEDSGELGALKDSGYRKSIFVRWDLVCQMMNHLTSYKHDNYDSLQEFLNIKGGLKEPLMEFTYMTPNQKVWTNRHPDGGRETNYYGEKYYLRYSVPDQKDADPTSFIDFWGYDEGESTSQNQYNEHGNQQILHPPMGQYTKSAIGNFHPHIGSSFDSNICLMPHMPIFFNMHVKGIVKYDPNFEDSQEGNRNRNRTSEEKVQTSALTSFAVNDADASKTTRNSIGMIYLNLDYLLKLYEEMRFTRRSQTGTFNLITLNRTFNMLSYVKEIWAGVNDACAGQYNFRLVTEHERPNKCRIVDLRVSGTPKKDQIYEFEPQGLNSVTRQFFYDSKISADMSSAISIAAQAPKDINSLDALSFKAFNRNITSRFSLTEDEDTQKEKDMMKEDLERDIENFLSKTDSLNFYLYKLNMGHWVITSGESTLDIPLINSTGAIALSQDIRELRASILARYPLEHKEAGYWREGTTQQTNPIIPLQFSYKMDGLSGMEPLRIFKIAKHRLPIAYNRDDVAFIIKSEQHKISNTQDWTVDVTGQLVLLDINPNDGDGFNRKSGNTISNDWKVKQLTRPEQPNADIIRNFASSVYGTRLTIKKNTSTEYMRDWGLATDELTSNKKGLDITLETAVGFVTMMFLIQDQGYKLATNPISSFKGDMSTWQDITYLNPSRVFPLSEQGLTFVLTSGRDLMHEGFSSKHNAGQALDIVVYWASAPGGKRKLWKGKWGPNQGPNPDLQVIDKPIMEGLNKAFDLMVSGGILKSYQNEYTDPSGPATAPHYHLRFHSITVNKNWLPSDLL